MYVNYINLDKNRQLKADDITNIISELRSFREKLKLEAKRYKNNGWNYDVFVSRMKEIDSQILNLKEIYYLTSEIELLW